MRALPERIQLKTPEQIELMRTAGLVDSSPGPDARTRTVDLTDGAREVVGFLDAEWRATEAAWDELQAELPTPLQHVVDDMAFNGFRKATIRQVGGEGCKQLGSFFTQLLDGMQKCRGEW